MKKITLIIALSVISMFAFSQENQVKTPELKTSASVKKTSNKNVDYATKRLESSKQKKEKYIKFSSVEFRTKNNIPVDFPKYKNTGNVVNDTKQYDIQLKHWISNNEEKYQKIKNIINF